MSKKYNNVKQRLHKLTENELLKLKLDIDAELYKKMISTSTQVIPSKLKIGDIFLFQKTRCVILEVRKTKEGYPNFSWASENPKERGIYGMTCKNPNEKITKLQKYSILKCRNNK